MSPTKQTTRWIAMLGGAFAVGAVGVSCGRTFVDEPPPLPDAPTCVVDADCPGYGDFCAPVQCIRIDDEDPGTCVDLATVSCDDNDPCTLDNCEPDTGTCRYEPATRDNDGDGFKGPREGFLAGEPGSCGTDCDDTSALAFPGGTESCDGADNDCNGVVDDDSFFVPLGNQAVRISGDISPAGVGGLAFSGTNFAATYWGNADGFDMYRQVFSADGQVLSPEERVTAVNADNSGGPIVWTGDRFGLAWQDRRDNDYEIYFTLLDALGTKIAPDTRLTFAPDFSVGVQMDWTGQRFVLVWQDARFGAFNVFGQMVSIDGAPIGGNVPLGDSNGFGNESPDVAAGTGTVGVVWNTGNTSTQFIEFSLFDNELNRLVEPFTLTDGSTEAINPTVVYNDGAYVIAWFDRTANPKAIYAAVVDEATGQVTAGPQPISEPGAFRSRYPHLMPLGDRLLVVYADDRDQNDGYELYSRMIADDLQPIGPELRLTNAPRDSINPVVAFGNDGDVGVLFRDDREGEQHVFFTRLICSAN